MSQSNSPLNSQPPQLSTSLFTHPADSALPRPSVWSRADKSAWSQSSRALANPARSGYPFRFPASAWRNCGAMFPHTTHEPLSAKIEYRHHPCYGMEVQVVRARRRGPDAIAIVQRPDGLQIAVPRWMLDPLACQQLPQAAKPRVALRALVRLAELVGTRDLPVRAEASVLEVSPSTQGPHASQEKPSLLSAAVAPAQENALAPVPRSDARAVSITAVRRSPVCVSIRQRSAF